MSCIIHPQLEPAEIISRLFPKSVDGLIQPIDDYIDCLKPEEFELIQKATDKRRFEFSTGRWCAKTLLQNKYNLSNVSILAGEDREPIWPASIKGSISHCKDLCGAVTTNDSNIRSLGFDIENIREFKEDIAQIVCTEEERIWLYQHKSVEPEILILLLFSIKESLYKCVYGLDKNKTGFQDYSLEINLQSNTAALSKQSTQQLPGIKINFLIEKKHIYSSVTAHKL